MTGFIRRFGNRAPQELRAADDQKVHVFAPHFFDAGHASEAAVFPRNDYTCRGAAPAVSRYHIVIGRFVYGALQSIELC